METKQAEACKTPTLSVFDNHQMQISYNVLDGSEKFNGKRKESFILTHYAILLNTVVRAHYDEFGYDFEKDGPIHIDLSQQESDDGEVLYPLELNEPVDSKIVRRIFAAASRQTRGLTPFCRLSLDFYVEKDERQAYLNAYKVVDAIWGGPNLLPMELNPEIPPFKEHFNEDDEDDERCYEIERYQSIYSWIQEGNNQGRLVRAKHG